MYQKIVVAYDGTGPGDAALHQGAELARLSGCALHLVGVVVTSGGLMLDPTAISPDLLASERQILQAALSVAARDLGARGIVVETHVRDGDATREIVAAIHAIGADLVVVGHGHKGLLARWFDGSVGTQLLDAMPCSLLVAVLPDQAA